MDTIKIITCNARLQTAGDKEQQFLNRVDFLCEKLIELDADVIGFQEMLPIMRKEMIARMPGYAFLGAGRGIDRLDEGSVIAYKQMKLIPERLISDILSETPHVPGTTYGKDQSNCPRIFSSCDFMPIDGGEPFRVMNIHTDHLGCEARMLEVKQLMASYDEQQKLRPMPTVITGDFNATPDKPEIVYMTESGKFKDITAKIETSFHGFGKINDPSKIDYIFVTDELEPIEVDAHNDKRGNLYLSDHMIISATVKR